MGASFIVFRDSVGEWRWHTKAANGKIVATSGEGYKNLADCLHGIGIVMGCYTFEVRHVTPIKEEE